MTDAAIIQADFADFRQVKSRKVAQIICEIPLEQLPMAMEALGWPRPDKQSPVAITRLNLGSLSPEPPESNKGDADHANAQEGIGKGFRQRPASQQAAIKLQDASFVDWLVRTHWKGATDTYDEDALLKSVLGVSRKRELDSDPEAGKRWAKMLASYDYRDAR